MKTVPVRRARGFTLVEVLVAMAIMAIVAIMAWQGVDGIVRSRTASQDKLEQLLRVHTVLAQWEQDLTSLQDTGAAVPALAFDGARMTLTRRAPSGLQLVVWSLRSGTWMRWASPPVTTTRALQEHWLASQQFLGNEAGQLRALTGVSQWQVYFDHGDGLSNAQSTGDAATPPPPPPPGASGALQGRRATVTTTAPPKGVRMVLSFDGDKGLAGEVSRYIVVGQ